MKKASKIINKAFDLKKQILVDKNEVMSIYSEGIEEEEDNNTIIRSLLMLDLSIETAKEAMYLAKNQEKCGKNYMKNAIVKR